MRFMNDLEGDLQAVHRGSDATSERLEEREATVHELELKCQLQTEEAGRVKISRNVWISRQRGTSQSRGTWSRGSQF